MSAGNSMSGLRSVSKARMIGADIDGGRDRDDFYPTPTPATEALLGVEKFTGSIWEPACGDGAISRVLEAHGYAVDSTDLVDRGFGTGRIDFLLWHGGTVPNVITNPPFKLAVPFVRQALGCTTGKVAMLVKLTFLEGVERRALFEQTPLARIWVFTKRLKFYRGGDQTQTVSGGMMCFAWFVWDHGHTGKPTLGWI